MFVFGFLDCSDLGAVCRLTLCCLVALRLSDFGVWLRGLLRFVVWGF